VGYIKLKTKQRRVFRRATKLKVERKGKRVGKPVHFRARGFRIQSALAMAFNNALRSAAKLIASSESSLSTSGQILPFVNVFVICNSQILMQFVFAFTMMFLFVVL